MFANNCEILTKCAFFSEITTEDGNLLVYLGPTGHSVMDWYYLTALMTCSSYGLFEFVNLIFISLEMKGMIFIITKYKFRSLVFNTF